MSSLQPETASTTEAANSKPQILNPYHDWKCGFGFTGYVNDTKDTPDTKADFLEAVRGDITTITFIQNGLVSYINAINSGSYHTFSVEFLRHQTDAAHKTIGQLFHISKDLQDIVKETELMEGDSTKVKVESRGAHAHAKLWIQRTRAILVSAHVFYKINYVLGV